MTQNYLLKKEIQIKVGFIITFDIMEKQQSLQKKDFKKHLFSSKTYNI